MAGRRADLDPSLGHPGGPCYVVQRIDKEVRNPRLHEHLINEVERGDKLTNPEAAKIYDVEHERGEGLFKRLAIGPHAQYRMDLRGVTVPQVRATLKTFSKLLNDWKSRRDRRYEEYAHKLQQAQTVSFTEPRMGLTIVIAMEEGRDTAKLVSTWWQGEPDPPAPRHCELPRYAGIFFSTPSGMAYSYDRRTADEHNPDPISFKAFVSEYEQGVKSGADLAMQSQNVWGEVTVHQDLVEAAARDLLELSRRMETVMKGGRTLGLNPRRLAAKVSGILSTMFYNYGKVEGLKQGAQ